MVALLKRDPKAESALEAFIAREEKLSTTPINACELYKGAFKAR